MRSLLKFFFAGFIASFLPCFAESKHLITLPKENSVVFEWIDKDKIEWKKYKEIFIKSFSHIFEDFSTEELDLESNNKEQGIHDWYAEEVENEKEFIASTFSDHKNMIFFLEIRTQENIIGYAIWHWSEESPLQVYQSNLSILPAWQGKGIGTQAVYAIKEKLPFVTHSIADTRKTEKNKANLFYREHLRNMPHFSR